MPYIAKKDQEQFDLLVKELIQTSINTPGELNFLFTSLIVQYLNSNARRYQYMNDIVGALESAKAEFQRRVVVPYETQKAFEADAFGGDPYEIKKSNLIT